MPQSFHRSRPHVLLLVETSLAFGRHVLDGIGRYLVENPSWSVQLDMRELLAQPPAWLSKWDGDGMITRGTTPALARSIRKWGIPTVNLTDVYGEQGLPAVLNDHGAIGRMAAEHLMDKGMRHLAFAGFSDHFWSTQRLEGFQNALPSDFPPVACYESDWSAARQTGWERQQEEMVQWLISLPKPIGVLACNDFRGQHVLEACRMGRLGVPEEVSVIGVDNDRTLCEFGDPPLSSIIPAAEKIGFEAARMLDHLMRGERLTQDRVVIGPLGVQERRSTEVLAIGDAEVVSAVQMIRARACDGLTVNEILKQVPVARSSLERRFRKYLGRSPQAEIRRVQVEHAEQLLRETDLSLDKVSRRTGFKHVEYFSVVFKRVKKVPPGQYRKRYR